MPLEAVVLELACQVSLPLTAWNRVTPRTTFATSPVMQDGWLRTIPATMLSQAQARIACVLVQPSATL